MNDALDKIKEAIYEKGLRQNALAKKVNITAQHLSNVLVGRYPLSEKLKRKLFKELKLIDSKEEELLKKVKVYGFLEIYGEKAPVKVTSFKQLEKIVEHVKRSCAKEAKKKN